MGFVANHLVAVNYLVTDHIPSPMDALTLGKDKLPFFAFLQRLLLYTTWPDLAIAIYVTLRLILCLEMHWHCDAFTSSAAITLGFPVPAICYHLKLK